MKAVLISRYGPPEVLRIGDVAKPNPGKGEVRVRVHATTVCAGDVRIRKADPFFLRVVGGGISRPTKVRTPGMEFAGVVEALGEGVRSFAIGDSVFGSAGLKFGANAEYVCTPDVLMAAKPADVTYDQAAPIAFGGISALHYLRAAALQAGQKLLVYGATGSVGTAAVQIAKARGARFIISTIGQTRWRRLTRSAFGPASSVPGAEACTEAMASAMEARLARRREVAASSSASWATRTNSVMRKSSRNKDAPSGRASRIEFCG